MNDLDILLSDPDDVVAHLQSRLIVGELVSATRQLKLAWRSQAFRHVLRTSYTLPERYWAPLLKAARVKFKPAQFTDGWGMGMIKVV